MTWINVTAVRSTEWVCDFSRFKSTTWMVDVALASSNQIVTWLRRIDELRTCGAGKLRGYALRARTAGRSAGVGSRRAPAGSVATATVFPVMSKNSME